MCVMHEKNKSLQLSVHDTRLGFDCQKIVACLSLFYDYYMVIIMSLYGALSCGKYAHRVGEA